MTRWMDRIVHHVARRVSRSRRVQGWVGDRLNARGDRLDPQLGVMLWLQERLFPEAPEPTVAQRRAAMRQACAQGAASSPDVPRRGDRAAGLDVRWFEPEGAQWAVVYLHGGGWVVGDLDTHDGVCQQLAVQGRCVVIAVDYPLAPEAQWPEAIHRVAASWTALRQELIRRGIQGDRIALVGDSAGGNLCATVCRVLRDQGAPLPAVQGLIYPAVDARCLDESHREFSEGFMLTGRSIAEYLRQYGCDPLDPLASPVLADDLRGLPPALIAVAGFDPLRDEALRYERRLREAGVRVELLYENALTHGYVNYAGIVDEAARATSRFAVRLERLAQAGAAVSS